MMRCLSVDETQALFRGDGFSVSLEQAEYRQALVLEPRFREAQWRIASNLPPSPIRLPHFVDMANRWLPTNRGRLLWIDHWSGTFDHNAGPLVEAARRGLGELRSLEEAPGHLFGAHAYDQFIDPTEYLPDHRNDLGLLIGLTALVLTGESDGWLIAQGCQDRVEFWEGHIFFHSSDPARIAAALSLLDDFNCALWEDSKGWTAPGQSPT